MLEKKESQKESKKEIQEKMQIVNFLHIDTNKITNPGSEQYVKTRNGRNAMKCKCAECGITKFKFVKGTTTGSKTTKAKKVKDYYQVEVVHLIKYHLLEQFYKLILYMYTTYCVKQRKNTKCVPDSGTYSPTKNNKVLMKCICAECGITKSRFVPKSELQEGKGFDELIVKDKQQALKDYLT